MAEVIRETDEHGPVLEATPARQGRRGLHVFWVLLISTLLAALVLFAAWGWKSGDLTRADNTETPSAAQSAVAPPPTAANPGPSSAPSN
jgi:hypothetical protein